MGFGEILGVSAGALFASRQKVFDARVHRPPIAGICGSATGAGRHPATAARSGRRN